MENVRPSILQDADDPLFISLTGAPIRFGRLVTAFFQRVTGLHINTTRIRSMEATECATLLSRNEVTVAQRDSLQKVSGHSDITSEKYYEMLDRKRDMDNAIQVHQKLLSPTAKKHTSDAEHFSHSSPPTKRSRQRSSPSFPSESRQRPRSDLEECDADSGVSDISDTDSQQHRQQDSWSPPQSAYREQHPRSPSFPSESRQRPRSDLEECDADSGVSDISDTDSQQHKQRSPPQSAYREQHPRSPSFPSESRQRPRSDLEECDADSGVSHRQQDSWSPPQSSSVAAYRERLDPRSPSQPNSGLDSTVGILHPSIANRSGSKIPWTDIEINIVGTWCTKFYEQHGNHNVVASCLLYILNDSDIRKHFHPRHVMDNTRLRWAWEKYKKQ